MNEELISELTVINNKPVNKKNRNNKDNYIYR